MLDDRFWSKVNKSNHPQGCWVWQAGKNNKGYGLFRPGGIAPKELAHRLSFEAHKGQIPPGRFILHSCDNRLCVNPHHLRVGDAKENVADMDSRSRRVVHNLKGESIGTSKLRDADVISLRRDYLSGHSLSELCNKYHVRRNSLSDYTSGRSWTHLLGVDGSPTLAELKAENAKRTRSNARLTLADAEEIRSRLAAGETGKSIAAAYGVHSSTISDIRNHKIWIP
jgi:hypothetical protein